ncbi:MAG: hypothetical protein WC511_05060 [Candidatus Pacearchaeota archaeon]|jgi:hypothetical protein
MSKEDNYETDYRKKLTLGGSGLLVGSIFTGPAAPVVAAIGIGLIIGRAVRSLANEKAREEYHEEKSLRRKEKEASYQKHSSYLPESPETAVARETPFEASRLLKALAKEETTRYALNAASSMVHDYLSEVPEERLANSNGIYVDFKRKRNLRGLISGEDSGFELDIELK